MAEFNFEHDHAIARMKMEEAQRAHDRETELHRTYFEAASKSAEVAVKTSIFVNGGAAAAILAFVSSLSGRDIITLKQLAEISDSLVWFASGVGAGITALAFIYLMNYSQAASSLWRQRVFEAPYICETGRTKFMRSVYTAAHVIAVIVSLASLVLFIFGVLDVRDSISRF